ncbi:MAG TPA: isopentenyl phosphate kinase [Patescibacteria group bacterium]|nr:isopentenyl phosphate kinase [Patescibacteria group bacterium]
MSKKLVIIKLGGSVITDKKTNKPIFKKEVVKRIAKEIKSAQSKADFDLILVHGAGSFGHPSAKKYKLNEGYKDKTSALGVSLTKKTVLKLNLLVIETLQKEGFNAVLLESSTLINNSNKKINDFNTDPVKDTFSLNMIPVLSGDVVSDKKLGISIVSGDTIVSYLAKELKAKTVIFASDVDGIFDKNPKTNNDAKLIKKITSINFQRIIDQMKAHNINDVTGEMEGKLMNIKEYLVNTDSIITNGLKPNNIENCLLNRVNGTRIILKK